MVGPFFVDNIDRSPEYATGVLLTSIGRRIMVPTGRCHVSHNPRNPDYRKYSEVFVKLKSVRGNLSSQMLLFNPM